MVYWRRFYSDGHWSTHWSAPCCVFSKLEMKVLLVPVQEMAKTTKISCDKPYLANSQQMLVWLLIVLHILSCTDIEFHHPFGWAIMRLPPCSCLLVVTVLLFLCYCTIVLSQRSRRQLLYLGEPSVQGSGSQRLSEAGQLSKLQVAPGEDGAQV